MLSFQISEKMKIELYLYNHSFYENYEKNREAFDRYHRDETDSLNQSGILNLSNKNFDVAFTCAVYMYIYYTI